MSKLVIDLQDGFSNDTVAIQVNGQEIFRKDAVITDYSIGRADSVESQVQPGKSRVEVTLPARGLAGTVDVDVHDTVYLGVSLQAGQVDFRISDEMFYYF